MFLKWVVCIYKNQYIYIRIFGLVCINNIYIQNYSLNNYVIIIVNINIIVDTYWKIVKVINNPFVKYLTYHRTKYVNVLHVYMYIICTIVQLAKYIDLLLTQINAKRNIESKHIFFLSINSKTHSTSDFFGFFEQPV